jgi:hypothetical protein
MEMTADIASNFARIALGHVGREYPHKLDHVMLGDDDVLSPRTLHPVFFGSYDWHSCVHGWWTLLTLRRLYPYMAETDAVDALAGSSFTQEKLATELAYLNQPSARGFERPYGWGWLLYLHHESCRHADQPWGVLIEPMARRVAAMLGDYLKQLTYPVTVGTHYNTAFALVLAREWAAGRDDELVQVIDCWAQRAFGDRRDYRGWEPGGDEFLSPSLIAALLMSQIQDKAIFADWFARFFPGSRMTEIFEPATVSDRSDGKIAHLDGLNLSRAWCLRQIANGMAPDQKTTAMRMLADRHLMAALPHVAGDYMGEHWLASFALLALLAGGSD